MTPTAEERAKILYYDVDVRDGPERFIRVVANAIRAAEAAERERWVLVSTDVRQQLEAEWAAKVLAAREACAKIADALFHARLAHEIAATIRAGNEPPIRARSDA